MTQRGRSRVITVTRTCHVVAATRAAAIVGLAFATGCYTTVHVATIAPLHTAYPVSTSSQYVESGGIVTDKDYDVVHSFSLHHVIEAQPHHETLSIVSVEPDLDRIVHTTGGDAITGMTIQAIEYDAGSHYPSAGLQLAGWTFGCTGAGVMALGAAVGDQEGTKVLTVGAVLAGLGVISYVIGKSMTRPATWQLEMSGNVVKRKAARSRGSLVRAGAP